MRNWGIGLIAFAVLGFLGYLVDPEESLEAERNRTAVVVFVVMAGSGGVLFKKGQSYIDQMKNCAQKSLRHIREKGFIDSMELSNELEISDIELMQLISKAQEKSFIPLGITIR